MHAIVENEKEAYQNAVRKEDQYDKLSNEHQEIKRILQSTREWKYVVKELLFYVVSQRCLTDLSRCGKFGDV